MAPNDTIVNMPMESSTAIGEKDKAASYVISAVEIDPARRTPPGPDRQFSGLRKKSTTENALAADQKQVGWDGEEDAIRTLGKIYSNILSFNILTRYACFILPVSILLAIPLAIFATVAKDTHAGSTRLVGLFIWLEIVWVGLWVAKLCAKTLPKIFQVLSGMVSASTRKNAELIKALEFPISMIAWTILAWATVPVATKFDVKGQHGLISASNSTDWSSVPWPTFLRRILLASIPVSVVFFIEKAFIQLIAVDYHRKQFTSKINESKYMIGLLTELYTASVALYPAYSSVFEDDDFIIHNTLISMGLTRSLTRNNSPAAKAQRAQVKIFGGIARVGNGVTSVFNNIATEVIGSRELDPNSDRAVVIAALEKKVSAEALARRLWMSIAEEGNSALYETDIAKVLGPGRQIDAEVMFRALDKDRNGDVSLDEMQAMLVDLEQSQKAMVRSMHDVKQSVAALDRILAAASLVPAGIIYAAFFSADFVSKLTVLTTTFMSFSFAFAGTVQEFASSCIFIFVKHPYDIDDRVEVNGVEMIVKHISLLYTVFTRVDTNRTVQIPNTVNNNNWIENVSRSGTMKERIYIRVDPGTSADDIETLSAELHKFVIAPDNKRDYQPHVIVDVNSIGDLKSLELRIEFGHKSNWANETLRATRRARFMAELVDTLRRIPIYSTGGGDAVLGDVNKPTYSVAVSDQEAQASRAKFAADKAAKRLVVRRANGLDIPSRHELPQVQHYGTHLVAGGIGRRGSAVSASLDADADDLGVRRMSAESRGVRPAAAVARQSVEYHHY